MLVIVSCAGLELFAFTTIFVLITVLPTNLVVSSARLGGCSGSGHVLSVLLSVQQHLCIMASRLNARRCAWRCLYPQCIMENSQISTNIQPIQTPAAVTWPGQVICIMPASHVNRSCNTDIMHAYGLRAMRS